MASTSDTDLTLKIGGDASGAVGASAEVKEAVKSVSATAAEGTGVFAGFGEAALAALERIALGASSARTSMIELGASVQEARATVNELGEAMIAAFAVEKIADWAAEMAEGAERSAQLGEKLGMSTTQVQEWGAVATLTGRSTEEFTNAFTRLTDNLVKGASGSKIQAAAMRDLGLSAKDALDPNAAILKIAERFAEMGDGPGAAARKIADSMALMGRSGANMIPILNGGSAAIQEMMDKGAAAGTVLDSATNAKMLESAEAINQFKLDMQGLSTQGFVQLIPLIESFAHGMADATTATTAALQPGSQFRQIIGDLGKLAIVAGSALTAYLVSGFVATQVAAIAASGPVVAFMGEMALMGEMAGISGQIELLGAALTALATEGLAAATTATLAFTAALLANPITWVVAAVAALAGAFVVLSEKTAAEKAAHEELIASTTSLANTMGNLSTMTAEQVRYAVSATTENLKLAQAHLQAAIAAEEHAKAQADLVHGTTLGFWAGLFGSVTHATQAVKDETVAVQNLKSQLDALSNWKPPADVKLPNLGGDQKGESQVGKWTQELHQDEIDAANASGDFMKDQSELEMAFWQSKLALTTTNSKAWFEIQDKIYQLTKASQTEAYNSLIAGDKAKIAADAGNHAQWLADWNRYLADVARAYPDDTARYKAALEEKAKAEKEFDDRAVEQRIKAIAQQSAAAVKGANEDLAATKAALNEQIEAIKATANDNIVTRTTMWSKIEALQNQETAAEVAAAQKELQAKLASAQQIAALKQFDYQSTVDSINAQSAVWVAYYDKLQALASKGMQQQIADQKMAVQQMQSTIQPFVNSFDSGMLQMAEGAKSFGQVVRQMGAQMLNAFMSDVVDKMVAHWLAGEILRTTASSMGNAQRAANDEAVAAVATIETQMQSQSEITAAAAVAAANTFASISAIPVVGPAMAPEAAAAAMAAVNAFRVSASAAGGYDIPSGVNPITQLHAQEMVLPPHIANPLRAALGSPGGQSAFGAAAAQAAGGDTHVHIHANDADSVKAMFERNGAHMVSVIKRQLGNGALLGAKR